MNATIDHMSRGEIELFLTSPWGTVSQLMTARVLDNAPHGYSNWTFMTVFSWGEVRGLLWAVAAPLSFRALRICCDEALISDF